MKLLLDVGNTRIKWATEMEGELNDPGSLVHRGLSPDEAVAFVAGLTEEPASVWAVNVAGAELQAALAAAVRQRFSLPLQTVATTTAFRAVTNGYTACEQLGVDRWAAVVAAWSMFKRPICVADVGTAVTLDLVAADGNHRGGIILPGLRLMTGALRQDTSDIEGFASNSRGDVPEGDWFGRDTLTAIQRGAIFALRSTIVAAAETLATDAGSPLVVMTGGDAEQLGDIQGCEVVVEPLLVLKGLALLSGSEGQ